MISFASKNKNNASQFPSFIGYKYQMGSFINSLSSNCDERELTNRNFFLFFFFFSEFHAIFTRGTDHREKVGFRSGVLMPLRFVRSQFIRLLQRRRFTGILTVAQPPLPHIYTDSVNRGVCGGDVYIRHKQYSFFRPIDIERSVPIPADTDSYSLFALWTDKINLEDGDTRYI